MSSFMMSVLAFVSVLSPLVFLHELGHYLAAKACGVHVERFSIVFGPKIFSWKDKSGTEWIFSWILLGGYVQMLGDANVASSVALDVPDIDASKTMAGKSHMQRIAIAGAGPAVNYLLAFILFVGLFVTVGKPHHRTLVGQAAETSYAYKSGVRPGDRVTSVQSHPVATFEDVVDVLKVTPANQPLTIDLERDDHPIAIVCNPVEKASGFWMGKLQFGPDKKTRFYVKQSWAKAVDMTLGMLNPLPMLKSLTWSSMGGPIGIAHQAGSVWQEGLVPMLFLMAALSLGLGFFNLLPLPVLDGGMIGMEIVEWVIGRPLSTRMRQGFSVAAFGLLMGLLLFLSWGDLMRIPAIAAWAPKMAAWIGL